MWERVAVVLGGLVLAVVVVGLVWFVGMRTKFRPVIDLQRRVNRRYINPRQMRSAGQLGAYAGVVHHVGRTSGRTYDTPVVPYPGDDGFVIVLPYGTRPDWVRNVLAAGSATIELEGRTHRVVDPVVLPIAESPVEFPASEARSHRTMGVTQCLAVHSADVGAITEAGSP
jgi:deazaflavin-dependent oxidoreductase (nitroreductase family)